MVKGIMRRGICPALMKRNRSVALPFRPNTPQTIGVLACSANTPWPSAMIYLPSSVLSTENQKGVPLWGVCVCVCTLVHVCACLHVHMHTQSIRRWTYTPAFAMHCDRCYKRGLYSVQLGHKEKAMNKTREHGRASQRWHWPESERMKAGSTEGGMHPRKVE